MVQVEVKLARRLEAGLRAWTQALVSEGTGKEEIDMSMDTDAPAQQVHKLGGDPKLKVNLLGILDANFLTSNFIKLPVVRKILNVKDIKSYII